MVSISIRREEKEFENLSPLIPEDINYLKTKFNITTIIQPSNNRIIKDSEYSNKGALVEEDISSKSEIIIGLYETLIESIQPSKTYLFNAQLNKKKENLVPLLKKLISSKASLIDYEHITDTKGRPLIHFGTFAGNAGMIDSFWALGQKLLSQGLETPFLKIKQAYTYGTLEKAIESLKQIGKEIDIIGLNFPDGPLIIGILGSGNVSKGVQEIINCIPSQELKPEELEEFFDGGFYSENRIYYVIFQEKHMVKPKELEDDFELQDYYANPDKYESQFVKYIPYLTAIINTTYWDDKYPTFITIESLKRLFEGGLSILRVIGDFSCILNGSIELTVKVTTIKEPTYTFDLNNQKTINGFLGKGPAILSIENLACELPYDSSKSFSSLLKNYIPQIVNVKLTDNFEQLDLPEEIKKGIIIYKGKLTPNYKYLMNMFK